jgi:hypothetical protein
MRSGGSIKPMRELANPPTRLTAASKLGTTATMRYTTMIRAILVTFLTAPVCLRPQLVSTTTSSTISERNKNNNKIDVDLETIKKTKQHFCQYSCPNATIVS